MLIKSLATEQLKTISAQAPRFYIQPKIHKQGNPGKTVITTFVSSILTLNNFVFNGKSYSEIKGCAMGTICAPAYNNIFMGFFERKYIYLLNTHSTDSNIQSLLSKHLKSDSKKWKRTNNK